MAPEREDGRLEGLPLLLFWVGAPTEGLLRVGATAVDYKRKRHQQGAADILALSPGLSHQPALPPTPLHPPTLTPTPSSRTPHSSQLTPLGQIGPFLPIGGNSEKGRKTDPLQRARVGRER